MAAQFSRGAGGKFTGSIGGVPVPPTMQALFTRLGAAAGGSLAFDPARIHGTGYGYESGDPRVKMLQAALNAAGFGDASGHSLNVDGKLGPLTTSAIKAAQKRLGVKQDGVVTPKLLAQILGLPKGKQLPSRKPAAPVHKPGKAAAKFKAAAPKKPAASKPKPSAPKKAPAAPVKKPNPQNSSRYAI
jgi:peptidoglycan hydrolase-like protein with peptidoglycan-binding domain